MKVTSKESIAHTNYINDNSIVNLKKNCSFAVASLLFVGKRIVLMTRFFMVNDHINTICDKLLHFNKHLN